MVSAEDPFIAAQDSQANAILGVVAILILLVIGAWLYFNFDTPPPGSTPASAGAAASSSSSPAPSSGEAPRVAGPAAKTSLLDDLPGFVKAINTPQLRIDKIA